MVKWGCKMKPTIYDVAKEAGVSIATVSKVINNNGNTTEKTKKKVLHAMEKLNYYPSAVASALTGKKTGTIGLLLPDISNPFYAQLARSIEDQAHELGMSVFMCSTEYDSIKERKYIDLLRRKQVDGFIVGSGFNDQSLLESLESHSIPIVMVSQDIPSLKVNTVTVDDYQGGYIATQHLISLGHKRIAIISERIKSSNKRIYGYKDAHEDFGLEIKDDYIIRTKGTIESGRKSLIELLQLPEPPSAIFATNELLAIGVIQEAREKSISIPDDLSIIGFDNTILATITIPTLTTVSQPIMEMGKKVVNILSDEIDGKNLKKQRTLFLPELIIRGTTSRYDNS
jgi:DNA-binding LacI/PurR family transcriptional regulator